LLDSIAEYFVFSFERYTSKKSASGTAVYAISLAWPRNNKLTLAAAVATPQTTVSMLGYKGALNWKSLSPTGGIVVLIPPIPTDQLPCQWAWVFKLENLAN
jgi:alpha-L-fucosidase